MNDYQYFLDKVSEFHRGTCIGTALGTRITLAALRYLDLDPRQDNRKSIIAYVEIDRCMTDAVQAITGCSLGRRSLKHIDYGKFAATFINLKTGRAVRGTVKRAFSGQGDKEKTMREIAAIPDEELVTLDPVHIDVPENDMPGSPRERVYCSSCGERVVDGRHVEKDGIVLCRGCAGTSYYRAIEG